MIKYRQVKHRGGNEMENQLLELIKAYAESNATYDVLFGIRAVRDAEEYSVGDIAEESFEWDLEHDCSTYFTTGERTDGTCAVGDWIEVDDEDDLNISKIKSAIENAYDKLKNCILLLGTREGEYGTRDSFEVRIQRAEVALVGL